MADGSGSGADFGPLETSPLDYAASEQRRATLGMVRRALDRKQVLLAFQPVVHTRRPDKAAFQEGLIRVLDETGRVIPAGDFMPAVETDALGRRIDCAALELGLEALAEEPSLRLAVNMSARSIGYAPWTATLNRGLAADPTAGERLILEITESSAMLMPDLVTGFMESLQRHGVTFALDDFGAGFTAFRHFRDFDFDILKIDGQFITGIATNRDNQVLTSALVSIARHFEMFTVAEAVESEEDAAYLATLGIDCMQGYHFAVPTTLPAWRERAEMRRA